MSISWFRMKSVIPVNAGKICRLNDQHAFQICRPCDHYMLSRFVDLVTTIYFPHVDIRPTVSTLCPGLVDVESWVLSTSGLPTSGLSTLRLEITQIRINNILITMTMIDFVITLLNGVNICLHNWFNLLHEDNGHSTKIWLHKNNSLFATKKIPIF